MESKRELSDPEKSKLLLLEYQAAWENYRHLFGMRFDLLKYLFAVFFAVAGASPVVLNYSRAQGVGIRSSYLALLLLILVSALLALLALLVYGILVNWSAAIRKHHRRILNIRRYFFGHGSTEEQLVTIILPGDPVEDRFLRWLHSSPPAMELVTVLLLLIVLVVNWTAALWLSAVIAPRWRLLPFLCPLTLTILPALALGRRALLIFQASKAANDDNDAGKTAR